MWLFVRLLNHVSDQKKTLLALFAVNLALVYTHYYGWLVIGVQFLILVLWDRRKLPLFSVSVMAIVLCFIPWAYAVTEVASEKGLRENLSWIGRPGLGHLSTFYAFLNGPILIPRWGTLSRLLLFGTPILLWAGRVLRSPQKGDEHRVAMFWWLSLFSFLPIVLSFLVSQVFPESVWGERHLIIVAAPYMILVAVAVYRLRPYWLKAVMVFLVLAWSVWGGYLMRNRGDFHKWDVVARRLVEAEPNPTDEVKVYALDGTTVYHLWFHLDLIGERKFQPLLVEKDISKSNLPFYIREVAPTVSVENITDLDGDHFWVAYREDWCTEDWCKQEERPPQKIFIDAGYEVGEGFRMGPSGREAVLFPVWRRQIGV
ncbi:MAG: hypothetical protein ABR568_20875 [Pyrinomonadaceae bacterium]